MSRRRRHHRRLSLEPETRHGIVVVALFAFAFLLLLSLFDLAGRVGAALDGAMAHVFGWDRIVLPFFLAAIGYHRVSSERLPLSFSNYIGFLLFFAGLNPLVHLLRFPPGDVPVELLATAGGKLGLLLADPFRSILGAFGAGTLFAALFVVSLLLIFNTSLARIIGVLNGIVTVVKKIGNILTLPLRALMSRGRRSADVDDGDGEYEEEEMEGENEDGEETEDADAARVGGDDAGSEHAADAPVRPKRRRRKMVPVPLDILAKRDQSPTAGDIEHNQSVIARTLENFGIPVEMGGVAVGPTVTQFTLKPAEGVKLTKITALHNDLALALAAHPIRIEAPIPGKSYVGVEVPNQSVATVGVRGILETREWKARKNNLHFCLGHDVAGKPNVADLARMPHLLVAGATGSGKSVCLNVLLTSLLFANSPDELKLILVDPKRVELPVYNGIPHLVTPVITDVEKTVNALKWAIREMDRRFDLLSAVGCRDIGGYNQRAEEKIPYLVVVVDELADLMMTAQADVEGAIVRLAQMARAVGIHLVLATQRPSVDVITGLIKANIPARMAFSVASSTDSRTILDQTGAEKLLGRGDMLYMTAEMSAPRRLQGAFVSDDETKRLVDFLKASYDDVEYDTSIVERHRAGTSFGRGADEDADPLLEEAKEEIVRAGKASASLLQRRLKVGYARAARILDELEQLGFIGPAEGSKPREILNPSAGTDAIPVPPPRNTGRYQASEDDADDDDGFEDDAERSWDEEEDPDREDADEHGDDEDGEDDER